MTIEPVIVAAIAAVSGIVSGLVVSLVKPWGENWRDVQRDRRARRDADLDALKDNLNQWADKAWVYPEMRSQAAAIGDSQLIAHIGRVITADNQTNDKMRSEMQCTGSGSRDTDSEKRPRP